MLWLWVNVSNGLWNVYVSPHIFIMIRRNNGGITTDITLAISVRQGCSLSPLLFSIVTHSLLAMLSSLATNGDIVGLHLPSRGQLVAQVLANDFFHVSMSLA